MNAIYDALAHLIVGAVFGPIDRVMWIRRGHAWREHPLTRLTHTP